MKNIFFSLLIVLVFSACNVEVENQNALTVDAYWKTEADAQAGLNAVYNTFYKPDVYTRWFWFRTDLTSDEGFSSSPWGELKEWTQFVYNNYDFGEGNRFTYAQSYKAIFRCNQVIANMPGIAMDETKKNQILGQAYFVRALNFYNLAVLWGSSNKSIPIVLEPSTNNPGMQPEGHTEGEVFNQAIADLTFATINLPETWGSSEKGRASKGAALALRAKCYMQLKQWSDASADLAWLVEGQGASIYNLTPNYSDNFTKDAENNIESVFEIQYSDVNGSPAGDGDYDMNPNLGQNRGQFFAPPGIGWTDGEIRPWIVTEFKKEKDNSGNVDIRLRSTAFYEGQEVDFVNNAKIYKYTSSPVLWSQGNMKGRVFIRKYGADYKDYDDYYNPINIRLIRYADVLLLYAECLANSGNLPKAVGLVDRVRARVNMPSLATNHLSSTLTPAAFLKQLQMERTLELATEGHRWGDLKRWGVLDSQTGVDELKNRDSDFNNFVIGKHNCLPIPTTEKGNNPNQTQNPNY